MVAHDSARAERGRGPKGALNQARYSEIVEAAGIEFAEKGYQAARIEDIAARVGILKGSLYYYIESKEDLLFEIADRGHARGLGRVAAEEPEVAAADAPTRLASFIRRWTVMLPLNPPYLTVAERDIRFLSGERYETVMEKRVAIHQYGRSLIEQGIAEGHFDPEVDVGLATNTLFEVLNGTTRWFRPRGRLQHQDLAEWYVSLFLGGLGYEGPRP